MRREPSRRLLALFGLATLSLLVFTLRLFHLQVLMGPDLAAKALELWSRDVPIEPPRGRILDRNGEILATNREAYSVLVFPAQVRDKERTADVLARELGADREKLLRRISQRTLVVRLSPEGRRVDEDVRRRVEALALPGVYVASEPARVYPYGSLAAHVLGFVGIDNQGLSGLELAYDEVLRGRRGAFKLFTTAAGEALPGLPMLYDAPEAGYDVVTTLDLRLQKILENALDDAWLAYKPEAAMGVIADPRTGEILAMASRPTFDPNRYREYPPEVLNRNLPIWRVFEPGSTFKIVTLSAALQEKKVDLEHEHFFDPGYIIVAGVKIRNWKPGGHGDQTFLQVVENSNNPGFVELGLRLGKETLFRYIRAFGFGEKTGIDLPGEAKGILFPLERVGPVELATTAFGQGVAVTPIQQVAAVSAAVNGGTLYRPHLLKEVRDPRTGAPVHRREPEVRGTPISPETSAQVRYALESVVARGTGYRAYVDGYRVGGKTGTAQKVGPDGRYLPGEYIVSFVGFAPADDPRLVVYIAVDHPQGIQFGGVVAAPVAGQILDASLRALGVPPREGGIPREKYVWPEVPPLEVPDLVGMSVDDIRQSSYTFDLDVVGEGEVVVDQSPPPGTKLTPGERVRVRLGPRSPAAER
ncbi:MAG: Cell division protein FtsI [Peptidoglycan synthetase] [Brockia lithotrophica]|uniref:Cell division protein FtsI [Peptidoglycan synthetase] n=1 Tax=Brockia lithotrophica TaxID=933949 RepID=A0A2T5G8F0_9BACL|nr:stage V sporulation protein D [Brockia lithotrophica]PTQ52466.1 MAG: Cell division protein FtsI [Peptidoglycan synthetase] [Brockia lithotrophica]